MWRGFTTARCTAFQEATMSNLCKRGIENIGFSSHVCYDFCSILRPRRLRFRGLGHPSVAFWTLWVTRLIPGSHFVNLLGLWQTLGSQVGRQSSGRSPKEPQMRPSGTPFLTLWQFFLRFPTTLWTARPSIRCSRRSPNDVAPFWNLLQK